MRITFTTQDFTLADSVYYSPSFRQDEKDALVTVGALLDDTGTVTLQISIDETDWGNVADATISCAPYGIQIFSGGHPLIFYRLTTTIEPIEVKILI